MTHTDPTADADAPVGRGAGGLSLLTNLRGRRESIVQEQFLDKKVPRWSDPEIWVRYVPVDFDIVDKARRLSEGKKGDKVSGAILLANIDCLVAGCIGVYATLPDVVDGDGDPQQLSLRPGDPEGEWTRFDQDLAVNLGMNTEATARQVVRTLFLAEGDILSHASELAKFSGYAGEEADDRLGE